MRIAIDVMGGDHGCEVILTGVRQALSDFPFIERLFVVGPEDVLRPAIQALHLADDRLEVVPASQVLSMQDKPVEGLRRKKDCSVLRAIELVKDGRAQAVISPGNTGGLVAAAAIRLRSLPGVERPAIATVIPSRSREFVLLDSGANPECKPLHLAQYAVMGSVYAREILGHERPRVGILSNGTELMKGTPLTRQAAELCARLDLNFVGYIEGYDLFADGIDVVVTDGFTGNIVLKTCESMGKSIVHLLKQQMTATPVRKLGALMARGGFRFIRDRMNPDAHGGAPLLGLQGNVIKAHGSSREVAIRNAIRVAAESIQHHLSETIQQSVQAANEALAITPESAASS